jgi:hypothetical protein
MTGKRVFGSLIPALLLLSATSPAPAGSGDLLVVEQLPDPDPGYVPPPPEKIVAHPRQKADEIPTLDQAFENLGRVTGQMAQKMSQQSKASPEELEASRERLRKLLEKAHENSGN